MDTSTLVLALMRPIERLLAVGIGGLSIYLGYRMFLALPEHTDASGRVILPGGVDVRLSRIGPGAFFALFGALVVGLALWRAVAVEVPAPAVPGPVAAGPTQPAAPGLTYSGVSAALPARRADDPAALAGLRNDLADLNGLTPAALAKLPNGLGTNTALVLPRAKLALMQRAWVQDWGDPVAFEKWVRAGAGDPVPVGLERAAALYRHGTPTGAGP